VKDNKSGQLDQNTVLVEYCCGDQTDCQSRMSWEREILGPKENCEKEFGFYSLNKKTKF
jgi:hypothetical protein